MSEEEPKKNKAMNRAKGCLVIFLLCFGSCWAFGEWSSYEYNKKLESDRKTYCRKLIAKCRARCRAEYEVIEESIPAGNLLLNKKKLLGNCYSHCNDEVLCCEDCCGSRVCD